jgi:uncharacterized CHY-type Zn-finger protein
MDAPSLQVRRALLDARTRILLAVGRQEEDTDFCGRCHLPLPADEYEAYEFCPWCALSLCGAEAREDESRRILEHQWETTDDVQCGECGTEYAQPSRFPFRFCPQCGARFADEDELLIELPFLI